MPQVEERPAPRRSKTALLIGGPLVVLMAAAGALFLRHPKDLKQMTELDDGRARVGAEPTDEAAAPPLVKPKMAAPQTPASPMTVSPMPTSPTPAQPSALPASQTAVPQTFAPQAAEAPAGAAPQAASSLNIDSAVAAVKDFPLDGDRGNVAQWLQFSYSADPNVGRESWSGSEAADKVYIVEYRFIPSARGNEIHYLFEVDMDRGFVIGKNLEAKNLLAGGPPAAPRAAPEKAAPRAKARKPAPRRKKAAKAVKRTAEDITPQDVPLLPLPDEGELKPPAEDDGAFNADTVNTGL